MLCDGGSAKRTSYTLVLEGCDVSLENHHDKTKQRKLLGDLTPLHMAMLSAYDSVFVKKGMLSKVLVVTQRGLVLEFCEGYRVPRTYKVFCKIIRSLLEKHTLQTIELEDEEIQVSPTVLARVYSQNEISTMFEKSHEYTLIGLSSKAPQATLPAVIKNLDELPTMDCKQCKGVSGDEWARVCRQPVGTYRCSDCLVTSGKKSKKRQYWFFVGCHPTESSTWHSPILGGKRSAMVSISPYVLDASIVVGRLMSELEAFHDIY